MLVTTTDISKRRIHKSVSTIARTSTIYILLTIFKQFYDFILQLDLRAEVSYLCCERSDPLLVHGVQDAQVVPLDFQTLVFCLQVVYFSIAHFRRFVKAKRPKISFFLIFRALSRRARRPIAQLLRPRRIGLYHPKEATLNSPPPPPPPLPTARIASSHKSRKIASNRPKSSDKTAPLTKSTRPSDKKSQKNQNFSTFFKKPIDKPIDLCYNTVLFGGDSLGRDLGVAQLVARYLGVVEAASSSLVTQTSKIPTGHTKRGRFYCCALFLSSSAKRLERDEPTSTFRRRE